MLWSAPKLPLQPERRHYIDELCWSSSWPQNWLTRKAVKCKCLDTEYDKVKEMPKMGICSNSHCKLPKRRVERSKVLCCSKCFQRDYCSRKCQKADWDSHKKTCGKSKKLIEEQMQKYREQNKGLEGKSHHIVQVCLWKGSEIKAMRLSEALVVCS